MKKKILFVAMLFLLFNCEALFVENISNQKVILLAPTHNSEVANGNIVFNWEEVTDATEYEVQIAKPNFTNASQILLDSITSSFIISKTLEIGDYEWRVKASNSDFSTNYSTHSFSVN